MSAVIFNCLYSNQKGGMERVFLDYSEILNNSNYNLICLTSKNFPDNSYLNERGIKTINLSIGGHFDIIAAIKLELLIKKHQPDIIIAHNGRFFATINLARKFFNIKSKIIGVSHGGSIKRLINFDCIICVANHIEKKIIKSGFKKLTKTIYNATKLVDFQKSSKNNDSFKFGIISRLSKEKNIEIAINAFAKFNKETDRKTKLLIAGDGPQKQDLINLARILNIEDNVEFVGWINDKEEFFNKLDVMILCSLKESFGISIIESFNYKTPVIASEIDGPKEIIKNNETGFFFDPQNKESLILAMKKACDEKDNFNIMSENAYNDLKKRFSFDKMSNSLNNLINSILQ